MKILLTGASSFTGYWFLRTLSEAGHEVHATFTQGDAEAYVGIRGARVRGIVSKCTPVWNCAFGNDRFLALLKDPGGWDLLCHHGADVRDYRSPAFDYIRATQSNTRNLDRVLEQLVAGGCDRLLLTGSVFEAGEGAGEQPLRAFSPYGLSKGLTAEVFRYWAGVHGVRLAKFVIPNPFGPMEEKRFLAYLMGKWLNGETAGVNTPDYLRDNIHVSLLAKAYCRFVEDLVAGSGRSRLNPSGYVETQGAFAQRVAREMAPRLGKACRLDLARQTDFDEPLMRVNCDRADPIALSWDEARAWDDLADYYLAGRGQ